MGKECQTNGRDIPIPNLQWIIIIFVADSRFLHWTSCICSSNIAYMFVVHLVYVQCTLPIFFDVARSYFRRCPELLSALPRATAHLVSSCLRACQKLLLCFDIVQRHDNDTTASALVKLVMVWRWTSRADYISWIFSARIAENPLKFRIFAPL